MGEYIETGFRVIDKKMGQTRLVLGNTPLWVRELTMLKLRVTLATSERVSESNRHVHPPLSARVRFQDAPQKAKIH
jgi:hypothetical protein